MRRAILALGLLLPAATGTVAQQPSAENLLTGLPDGFVLGYEVSEGAMVMHEYVPAGEDVHDWSTMVTVQVFRGQGGVLTDDFGQSMGEGWNSACAGAANSMVAEGSVNGYPYADWHFNCPLSPHTGKPEAMWLRAVSGNDAFYIVQYAFRAEASDERAAVALDYLRDVSVCDTRLADRPCPQGM